ncbi:MAG: phosphatase PAP2 family protein [Bacteroides sp.]|nr:phosphatase PAP2 family protein [Bacteroides sp.]MCM1379299.1 phosphatase PAP2 family protein [Bacteroides sp.]MCM1445042.1 phosphatase PAP2 family protein [Prevotella sp.]
MSFPNRKETLICVTALVVWLAVTALCVGMRPEHPFLALLIAALFFASRWSRKTVVALLPFIIFGISYDWMNIVPNYEVNPVDVGGIYAAEKSLFGIHTASVILTPNEFFALHTNAVVDFFCGLFYLCWVPVPIAFGLWLYFSGRPEWSIRFSLVFLLVNFIGFAGYYIHPAAPPWFVAEYGLEPIFGTPGSTAGLAAFDQMTGLGIFDALYTRNSNVFAAVPSLHSAYTFVAFLFALRSKSPAAWKIALGIITVGIWFTAVYTSHHYLIDVTLGICCALLGFAVFEFGLMKIPAFKRFIGKYASYISLKK